MKLFLVSIALLLGAAGIGFLLLWFGGHEGRAANYVCLECGRREWRQYDRHELISTTLEDDGSVFSQRFGAALPPEHTHDWMVDGCIFEGNEIANTGNTARTWIEILPRLSDSAGSEAIFREAIALPPERRREFIDSFVWALGRSGGTVDEDIAKWRAERK